MTRVQDIRRHDDGSIDFDFYRAYAVQLRREQRSRIVQSILSAAFNRAVTLMSRLDQRRRAELPAARWEHLRYAPAVGSPLDPRKIGHGEYR